MEKWKADPDTLVADTMSCVQSVDLVGGFPGSFDRFAAPLARGIEEVAVQAALLERSRVKSEREEIRKRVENFRAHLARLIREREDFANSVLERIAGRSVRNVPSGKYSQDT